MNINNTGSKMIHVSGFFSDDENDEIKMMKCTKYKIYGMPNGNNAGNTDNNLYENGLGKKTQSKE